jgi:hypothetical protein
MQLKCAACAAEKCTRCSKPLVSDGIQALGKPWHKECFVCSACSKKLVGKDGKARFIAQDGNAVCHNCNDKQLKHQERADKKTGVGAVSGGIGSSRSSPLPNTPSRATFAAASSSPPMQQETRRPGSSDTIARVARGATVPKATQQALASPPQASPSSRPASSASVTRAARPNASARATAPPGRPPRISQVGQNGNRAADGATSTTTTTTPSTTTTTSKPNSFQTPPTTTTARTSGWVPAAANESADASSFAKRKVIAGNEKCYGCKRELGESRVFVALGKSYHSHCFKCYKCKESLDGAQFAPFGSHPLCHKCTISRMAEKCAMCSLKITGPLVIALKKNWHPECLVCIHCKQPIANHDKVYRRGKNPCCPSCVETVFSDRYRPSKSKRPSSEISTSSATQVYTTTTPPRRTGEQLIESIVALLSEDIGIDYFLRFSIRDYSVENILFWLDVQQYKGLHNQHDIDLYSKSIFRKYVQMDSDLEINIDYAVRMDIEDKIESPTTTLYDAALQSIMELMANSCMHKFRNSPECAEMLRVSAQ